MNATETLLTHVLEGQKQFRVPLFQRVYSWGPKNWKKLWSDLSETIAAGPAETHFIGSVVSKTLPGTAEGTAPFLLIDGQQRLTTLSLLLAALRDHVRDADPEGADEIHNLYLVNAYRKDLARYKVLPTQADRPAYLAIIGAASSGPAGLAAHADAPVVKGYHYFLDRLAAADAPAAAEVKRAALHQLELVSVTLTAEDNEYRIFASLNGTGEPLSQADLIRNHVFMQLDAEHQDEAYHALWFPVQQTLGSRLAEFFRDILQAEGSFVREDNTHREWVARLSACNGSDEILRELERIALDADLWRRLIDPGHEADPEVRRRLHRLNEWRGRTLYPFLLNVLRARSEGAATSEEVAAVLEVCEGFMVRRFFSGIPTNQLNRLFLILWRQLPDGVPLPEATRIALSRPGNRFPTDEDFRHAVETFAFYSNGKHAQRKLVLQTLVEHGAHKETVDLADLTAEHVMPQHLSPEWRAALGDTAEEDHRRYLHRIGNLTLTGYNSEMSDDAFDKKRERLASSNLAMNRDIADHASWGPREITARGQEIAEHALNIWGGPADTRHAHQDEASV